MIDRDIGKYLIGSKWSKFESFRVGKSRGLRTGIEQIDRKIGGLPGLVCVMGEPKTCKSTFVMGIIVEKAREGHPIVYIEKENGLHRTRQRMLCYLSGLTLPVIRKPKLREEEQAKYDIGVRTLQNLPIYYLDSQDTKDDLEEVFLIAEAEHNKQVIIVVDSLQALITDFKDRRSDIDSWVNWFNDLKKKYEHRVTVLLVSEKNRAAYGQAGRAGAKESGGVEYKSELVLDLYPSKQSNMITLECTYFRDGETGLLGTFSKDEPFTYKLRFLDEVPE